MSGEERNFHPDQPRDPHTGKWIGVSGPDGSWVSEALQFASGEIDAGAGDHDLATLGFDSPNGRMHCALDAQAAGRLTRALRHPPERKGGTDTAAYYGGSGGSEYATGYASVERTGSDAFELELSHGDGSAPPEGDTTLTLTGAEMRQLADEVDRMSAARRRDTDAGTFDVTLGKDGALTSDWPSTGGKPIRLALTEGEADDIAEAINTAIGSIDEFPIDKHGNPLLGPDDAVAKQTVRLGGSELYITSYGQYGSGRLQFESSTHDWVLTLPDHQAEDVKSALGDASAIAAGIAENRRGDGRPLQNKGMAMSKTWTRRQREGSSEIDGASQLRAATLGSRSGDSPSGAARSLPFGAQLRAVREQRNGHEMWRFDGIASVTDTPYEMWDMFGPYEEVIERGAFSDTLAADPDVAFLVNHKGVTMARTRSKPNQSAADRTLFLSMGPTGLTATAFLNPKRQDVSDLILAIEDGNITEMSFAFMLTEGWWSEDFTTFRISKLDIHRGDVSAVNYGANPYTSVAARAREVLADLDHLPTGAARAALNRLGLRTDLTATVEPAEVPDERSIAAVEMSLETPAEARPTGRSIRHVEALLDI